MKKVVIGISVVTISLLIGLVVFSLLGDGNNLLAGQQYEWQGKPILEDQPIWAEVFVEEGEIYMTFEGVKEHLYPHMTKDVENKKVYIDVKSEDFIFENEEINGFVAGDQLTLNFNLKDIEGVHYIPIKALEDILQINVEYNKTSQIVMIDKKNSQAQEVTLGRRTPLVVEAKGLSKKIRTLKTGEIVRVYKTEGDYYFVRSQRGELGYIKKINIKEDELVSYTYEKKIFKNKETWKPEGTIGLVWDYVYQYSKDRSNEEKIPAVDVISPTWFEITSDNGNLKNKGDFQYAKHLQEKDYKVWGLVTNGFDPDLTSRFLASQEAQEHFIKQILIYSGLYQLDGINIDFENIHYKDRDALTNFVTSLTEKLHKMNLVVSIDVTIPSTSPNWSMVYDREKLGKVVDYVAVMTYDEHWGTSPKSGSVASIGWVEMGIQKTLELVPPEKVLLGLPFYTRLWQEEVQANGKVKVTSKAYGMEGIKEVLVENGAEVNWDEETGQYYSQYEKEGKTYKVWIEDARSLALKTTLVEKYGLAGIAAWRKDFETNDIWSTLEDMIKKGIRYEEMDFHN